MRRLPLILVLAALSAAAALVTPPPADAATPCWRLVVNDWLKDGSIDHIYEQVCYEEALDHLPTDLEEYSSLGDDIRLAQAAAQRGELPEEQAGVGVPPVAGGGGDDGGDDGGSATGDDGTLQVFLRKIGPRNADEVPIPLLVLGAIATLLMAFGAAGMVARRTAHRRLPPGF